MGLTISYSVPVPALTDLVTTVSLYACTKPPDRAHFLVFALDSYFVLVVFPVE